MRQELLAEVHIIVDDREPLALAKGLEARGLKVKRARLLVGDVAIGGIGIERKTRNDLESSIVDGRLFNQLKGLKEGYDRAILIVEGTERFERISRNALLAALSSLLLEGISVFFTRSIEDTIELIYWIARKSVDKKEHAVIVGRKPKSLDEGILFITASLPGVGEKLAMALLNHFGSLKAIANATKKELMGVEGIGDKKAEEIFKTFNEKWKG